MGILNRFPIGGGSGGVSLSMVTSSDVESMPASASDGTICVITGADIGLVSIDNVEPSLPGAGDLWLKTGFIGRTHILLTSTPYIRSYPFTAMQYIDDTWVFVRVFVYHDSWLELRAWLYEYGNMHSENGGAFVNDYIEGSYGSITYDTSYISIARTIAGSRTSIRKANAIDFTPFKTLKARVQISGTFVSPQFSLRIFDGSTQIAIATELTWATSEEKLVELNVENINDVYTLKLYVVNQCTFRVKEVWLE